MVNVFILQSLAIYAGILGCGDNIFHKNWKAPGLNKSTSCRISAKLSTDTTCCVIRLPWRSVARAVTLPCALCSKWIRKTHMRCIKSDKRLSASSVLTANIRPKHLPNRAQHCSLDYAESKPTMKAIQPFAYVFSKHRSLSADRPSFFTTTMTHVQLCWLSHRKSTT